MPSLFKKIVSLKYALMLLPFLGIASCVDENRDDCPTDTSTQLVFFTIADVLTGEDISATEVLEDIEVYFFDRDRELVDFREISLDMIRNGTPLDVTGMDLEGGYVSVWSNLENSISMSPTPADSRMEELTVTLNEDLTERGLFTCPGDIFFGLTQLRFQPVSEEVESDTVAIMRKNARLNITVRGLPAGSLADDYYFMLGSLYSGYDFAGSPQADLTEIMEYGEFAGGDFISPEPYIMIHNRDNDVFSDDYSLYVELYNRTDTRTATQVISGNRADDGTYINLRPGRTTNVLFELVSDGNLEVSVIITDWDEIYQWSEW